MNKKLLKFLPYIIALAGGAICGVILKRAILAPSKNVIGFNPDAYKPDAEALINSIEKEGDFSKVAEKYSPVDIANYAMEKYKTYENSASFASGKSFTIVDQEIRNAQVRKGDLYFEESASKSNMVSVCKRFEQIGLDGNIKVYNEASASDVSISGDVVNAKFNSTPDEYNQTDYKKDFGRLVSDMFVYHIHEKTVLKKEITPNGSGYKVKLELDPDKGGYGHRYQMRKISQLDKLPSFYYIKLEFSLDNTLNLVSQYIEEKFEVSKLNQTADATNKLTYYYFPNVEWEIPTLQEKFNYSGLRGLINNEN